VSLAAIETARLVLRPWSAADRAAYLALATDPAVGVWLGGTQDTAAAERGFARTLGARPADGQWLWALARKAEDRAVIGAISLTRVAGPDHPMDGCVEIGWRLIPAAWGGGYASEAAAAALAWGFANIDVAEIVSFTAASNARSEAVMRRIGLTRDAARDFDHPAMAEDHPLRPHIVYAARRPAQ